MTQATFHFQALDSRGGSAKGVLHAKSREDAYRQIIAKGLRPLRLTTAHRKGRQQRVTLRDLSHLTSQLSVLIEARIPLTDGLRSIADQEPKQRLREVLEDVANQIDGGVSVTQALSPHRQIFGEVYVETVRAAETSGHMIEVLGRLAGMLDRQYEMTKNVKGALMYPICVIGTLILAVVFLMMFVVPRFSTMFAARGMALPLPTQIVFGISDLIRGYWYLIGGLIIAGVFGLRRGWRKPAIRHRIDSAFHRIPFVRDLLRGLAISRFANVLGICLRSGLPLNDGLEMAGRASGRPLLQTDAEKLRSQVIQGGRLSDVIITCPYLPPFTRRMLAAGEEAGEMSKMCEIVARSYDRDVMHLAKNITTVIEPVLIVALAGMVLVIALAFFLPMWNMASLYR